MEGSSMIIKQISVFVENKQGRLYMLTDVLAKEGIDLKAMTIADTMDFGIMRCIVADPDNTLKVIRENNFTASITEVIAVEVPDAPGGLSKILKLLSDASISVEYLYSFVRKHKDNALIIFRVEDPNAAVKVLSGNGVNVLPGDELYNL
jgi:hypothetical protein